jgi:hypothetical protein
MRIVTLTVAAISLIPMIAFAADDFTIPESGGEAGCQSRVRRQGSHLKEITGKDKKKMHLDLYQVMVWRASV